MKIPVLFEDKNILVIDKPAGLVVHHDGKTKESALTDWILKNYPKIKGVGEPLVLTDGTAIDRPGIVHRIDRETSGAIVIAKNQKSFEYFKEQFKNRKVVKKYHAFVYGAMKDERGIIDRPIGRSKKDFRLKSAQRGARGKIREAITHYRVLSRAGGFSFVEIIPKTGRTHQIRVHFKAINHPIISDSLYAPKRSAELGFKRLALHAHSLGFESMEGKKMEFVAPYPADFKKALSLI